MATPRAVREEDKLTDRVRGVGQGAVQNYVYAWRKLAEQMVWDCPSEALQSELRLLLDSYGPALDRMQSPRL
jgi:hypothetical protein